MNEYLTKSDLNLRVIVKAEDENQAEKMHKEIMADLVEKLNENFAREDKSWEFAHRAFISITKLPKGK